MRFVSTKEDSLLSCGPVLIKIDRVNGNPKTIALSDANGFLCRIEEARYGGIEVLVPEPPKMLERFAFVARNSGGVIIRASGFETERDAEQFAESLVLQDIEVDRYEVEEAGVAK